MILITPPLTPMSLADRNQHRGQPANQHWEQLLQLPLSGVTHTSTHVPHTMGFYSTQQPCTNYIFHR